MDSESIEQAQMDAYVAVLKALRVTKPTWETAQLLAKLRKQLNISASLDQQCQKEVEEDYKLHILVQELEDLRRRGPSMGGPAALPAGAAGGRRISGGNEDPFAGARQMPAQMHPAAPMATLPFAATPKAGRGSAAHAAAAARNAAPIAIGGVGGRGGGGARSAPLGGGMSASPSTGSLDRRGGAAAQPGSRSSLPATSGPGTKKAGGRKSMSALALAVPADVDIAQDDLTGYVLEKRGNELAPFERCVVARCKHHSQGQRLTLLYGLDTASPRLENDVLRKNKANVLWRFVLPAQRMEQNWPAVIASIEKRAAKAAAPPAATAVAPAPKAGGAPSKRPRKTAAEEPDNALGPPFKKALLDSVCEAAVSSRQTDECTRMVAVIHEKREALIEQLAQVRLEELLAVMSSTQARAQFQSELDDVRKRSEDLRKQVAAV